MGLFAAAPIVLALQAGRLADRLGYHRPMRIAVGLTVAGGAAGGRSRPGCRSGSSRVLCVAAMLTGAGANIGLIAIQRTAGRIARRRRPSCSRVFSWLGLAPALSNVVGPVLAGTLIDAGGFRGAFVALLLLPLASLWWARRVPVEAPAARRRRGDAAAQLAGTCCARPGCARLLLVNWLLSASWDVHTFVVPILGHERGFSASAIGLVLGVFAVAVALVRLVIPALAHRLRESQVLVGAMLVHRRCLRGLSAGARALADGRLRGAAGLRARRGAADDHGDACTRSRRTTATARRSRLRSMTINFSSAVMPLMFGLAGAALGAAVAVLGDGRGRRRRQLLAARRIGRRAARLGGGRRPDAASRASEPDAAGCRWRRSVRRGAAAARRAARRAAPASRRSTIGVAGRYW